MIPYLHLANRGLKIENVCNHVAQSKKESIFMFVLQWLILMGHIVILITIGVENMKQIMNLIFKGFSWYLVTTTIASNLISNSVV
mgnify:CR=1 FL=1